MSAVGVPCLRPEVVLFFKAKVAVAWPRMDSGRREWLREALRTAHPGHDWISLT